MRFLKFWNILLFTVGISSLQTQAQPTIDPSFATAYIYQPSTVAAALQLSSGARVVAGAMLQADGQQANGLVSYLPTGTVNATFAANVALNQWQPGFVAEAPNGKFYVANTTNATATPMLVSGQVCHTLVRLNADGTLDPTFSAGAGLNGYLYALLVQPDGKVVLGGSFTSAAGQAARNLVRLTATGAPDTGFLAAGSGPDDEVDALALQPDGKLLAGGRFRNALGQPAPLLARFTTAGSLDPTFSIAAATSPVAAVRAVAVQANGNILISGTNSAPLSTSTDILVRLMPNGSYDASFHNTGSLLSGTIQVQPDGKILVGAINGNGRGGPTTGGIVRLLPTGATDATFQATAPAGVSSMQVLANGQLLIGGGPMPYPGAAFAASVALLNATGSRDPSVMPHLQDAGEVKDLAIQADGKLLIGGFFDEVNGSVANGLARLTPGGAPDASYMPNTAVGAAVYALALQPDGRLLVGGNFTTIGGSARVGLARLLATGAADPGFTSVTNPSPAVVQLLALQPDGQLLVAGANGTGFQRVSATGQPDPSFQPSTTCFPATVLVQPDGRIVVGGTYYVGSSSYPVVRLQADGSLDTGFLRTSAFGISPLTLALYPDGRLLVGGSFTSYGSATSAGIVRLRTNGTPDNTFSAALTTSEVRSIVIQPNQRIFFGGLLDNGALTAGAGTARLLADGTSDASYLPTQGPRYFVNKVAVQPDGRLVAAGSFSTVSGVPIVGITRLLDQNVLAVYSAQPAVSFQAWPIPTHDNLHVQVESAAHPHTLTLLNVLGQVVLQQSIAQGSESELTLSVQHLPAGCYIVRVAYAQSVATRQIVIQ